MESKDVWKIFACAWLGTAMAVSVGIYFTQSAWCLWALLFPASLSTNSKAYKKTENGYEEVE
ncbi:hypothetical protein KQI61_06095 [Anaerocolumna aminovalerica]|uniref:hypothetical protein n=1 Tax=Anaerocolumna aminovalerica TaxID=1527 RepID=UPI001C0E972A|nr:hypothetical protein [Anaerocolumna aminovalerica]MBU5331762.1 hypothetical protein [Anaerocolumna aminovalerica]